LLDSVQKVLDFRGRTPKKLGLDWSTDGYLALSALNVKNGYIDESIDAHYGNQELYDAWMSGNELHQGQVLFTTEAPMGNVAQVPDKKRYILSQRTIAFEVDERNITENYLATVLGSPNIFNRLTALSSGGTAKGVSQKSLSEVSISLPNSVEEQNKIGVFFKRLDYLITLHQRKCDKLISVKKSMLEKMFPKNGSNIPEIRFAGFTDPWEQRKLGAIVDRVTRKNANLQSTLPLTISAQYGLVDQVTYFNNRVASQNVSGYYLIKQGEFAYNKSSSEGFPFGAVKRLDGYEMGVLSTLYIVFALKPNAVNSQFLVSYYDTNNWHKQVSMRAAEGARNHGLLNISTEDFFDTELMIPRDKDEQERIGQVLLNLGNLITLHQRKLEKLKNIKKSMLGKMFV
jgi:type I restriction enzyme S subunit